MSPTKPRLIIHGGAGHITRENLPPKSWLLYETALRRIHGFTLELLERGVTALDAATRAVTLFEDCELFNCGKGAVSWVWILFCGVGVKEGGKGGLWGWWANGGCSVRFLRGMGLMSWRLR